MKNFFLIYVDMIFAPLHLNKTKQLEINNTQQMFIEINFLKINIQISLLIYSVYYYLIVCPNSLTRH